MEVSVSQIASEPLVGQERAALAVSAAGERIASLDALRILAAVGIIWFHMERAPLRQIGYAGLPVFLLVFYSLIVRQGPRYSSLYLVLRAQGRAGLVTPYVLGVGLVCLAYTWQAKASTFITALASLTFGVYLIHPIVAYGTRQILTANRHAAASILLTAGISGLITWGLMKTPVRRFL
jgi:peptidoglycan/LPS O-acetylase OafA/YrhL